MPLVSIITPVYNRQELIDETIQSVVNQIFSDWEMLIVDDGSTDETLSKIERWIQKDKRIKLFIRNREPKGASTCRNIGIKKAQGKYLIFLDSDDLLRPFALEQRILAFNKFPQYDFLVFQTEKFSGSKKNIVGVWSDLYINDRNQIILFFLSGKSLWHTSGGFWLRDSVIKYRLEFDEKLLLWQDVDFHLQALLKGMEYNFISDAQADVLYRLHDRTISQRGYDRGQRRNQIYFIKKYYTLFKRNREAKQILNDLAKKLIVKNIQSRYWDNVLSLLFWQITKI